MSHAGMIHNVTPPKQCQEVAWPLPRTFRSAMARGTTENLHSTHANMQYIIPPYAAVYGMIHTVRYDIIPTSSHVPPSQYHNTSS